MLERFSLRARLLVVVVVLSAIGLVVADVVTYTSLSSFLFHRTDRSLDAAHIAVEHGGGGTALTAAAPGDFIQIRDSNGTLVGQAQVPEFRGTTPAPPPKLAAKIPLGNDGRDNARYFTTASMSGHDRWRVRASLFDGGGQLIVATSLHNVDSTLHRLFLIELLVSLAVLGALALLGLWIVRAALRPLDAIAATAAAIAAGDLSQRVERAEPRTEVGRLGLALNAMLARLERAFVAREASEERLRQFLADASHELRTPLASIRGYAELFRIGAARTPAETANAMRRIEEESARMGVLVEDLLTLARLDETREPVRERLDMAQLARDAVTDAQAISPVRTIAIAAPAPAPVAGDPHQLRQVLANLMRNALVHTPPDTPIEVTVASDAATVRVTVRDHGPGLPPGDPGRLFERFWRSEGGRGRGRAGAGLGLAIVREIAVAHGGYIRAENAPDGGALFELELPARREPDDVVDAAGEAAPVQSRP
jgi:two-component system OmpR family sensor kinase